MLTLFQNVEDEIHHKDILNFLLYYSFEYITCTYSNKNTNKLLNIKNEWFIYVIFLRFF